MPRTASVERRTGETHVSVEISLDGQGAARWNLMGISRAHDNRIKLAHFLMQKTDRIHACIVGAE